ncbi:hypothetical protein K438DRAFT_128485 [Mycena galopus ATCC 62051]|nr:hypothetical protein K438DRAFT_128485 [Mycena galopus ATCC 62051]
MLSGKAGLLALNETWDGADGANCQALDQGKPVKIEHMSRTLTTFIVKPFLPDPANTESYICINSGPEADAILFTREGGVDSTPRPWGSSSHVRRIHYRHLLLPRHRQAPSRQKTAGWSTLCLWLFVKTAQLECKTLQAPVHTSPFPFRPWF